MSGRSRRTPPDPRQQSQAFERLFHRSLPGVRAKQKRMVNDSIWLVGLIEDEQQDAYFAYGDAQKARI